MCNKKYIFSNDGIDLTFKNYNKSENSIEKLKLWFEGYFYVLISNEDNIFHKLFFQLKEKFLIYKKSKNDKIIGYMDINNSFIKLLGKEFIIKNLNKKVYGLRFFKNKYYEEIYSENIELLDKFYIILKKYCILYKFRNLYNIKDVWDAKNNNYIVENYKNRKNYFCEIINKTILCNNIEKNNFIDKINILKIIKNKRFTQLCEVYEGNNFIYLLYELKNNLKLKDYLKNNKLNEKKCLNILCQILKGINYLQSKDIIKCNININNIIFNDNNYNEILLVNFNAAFIKKDLIKKIHEIPNIFINNIFNIDLYSAGVIFYYMLTGMLFNNNFSDSILNNCSYGNIKINYELLIKNNISPESIQLLEKLLIVNSNKLTNIKKILNSSYFNNINNNKKINIQNNKNLLKYNFDIKNNRNITIDYSPNVSPEISLVRKKKNINKLNLILRDINI